VDVLGVWVFGYWGCRLLIGCLGELGVGLSVFGVVRWFVFVSCFCWLLGCCLVLAELGCLVLVELDCLVVGYWVLFPFFFGCIVLYYMYVICIRYFYRCLNVQMSMHLQN